MSAICLVATNDQNSERWSFIETDEANIARSLLENEIQQKGSQRLLLLRQKIALKMDKKPA